MKSQGFGLYSWNLVGLLLPPEGLFGFLAGVPRDATHGQYEGEAFIGSGALLLLVLCVVVMPHQVVAYVRRYWVYVTTLAVFAAYAASNLVYASDVLLVAYHLPQPVDRSGQLLPCDWPLHLAAGIQPDDSSGCVHLPLVAPRGGDSRRAARCPSPAADSLACSGVSPSADDPCVRRADRHAAGRPAGSRSTIASGRFRPGIVAASDRGGYGGAERPIVSCRCSSTAARLAVPTNSVYTSRTFKDCSPELAWVSNPKLDEGTLYLLGHETVRSSAPLAEIARSNACITLEWAIVCSAKWSAMASERPAGPQGPGR